MGIAKEISVVGEYDFYSPDYKEFAKNLANLFHVNLELGFFYFTMKDCSVEKENEFLNFGYKETYHLEVSYYDYNEKNPVPEIIYSAYELTIPVELEDEKSLCLDFGPNNLFTLSSLPFSGIWRFFIEEINGYHDHYYKNHDEIVEFFLKIRNCYISILKKINCNKVVIWTDADYKTEEKIIYNDIPFAKNDLNDLIYNLETLDNVKLFNFMEVLYQKISIKEYMNCCLNIAFIDDF